HGAPRLEARVSGLPEEAPGGVGGLRGGPGRVPGVRQGGTLPGAGRLVERVHLTGVPSPSGRGDLPDGVALREGQPAPCVGRLTLHVTCVPGSPSLKRKENPTARSAGP